MPKIHPRSLSRISTRGFAAASRCIPTSVRPTGPANPSALLVRGHDRHGHFHAEARLAAEMSPKAIAAHRLVTDGFATIQNAGFAKT